MIPKIIHFCWFGKSDYPPIVKQCMDTWSKMMPDYQIKCWNEDNVSINDHSFMRDAYKLKKYAFVSDYARYQILESEGGIFLDCDVEVLKSFDDLLDKDYDFFVGFEKYVKKNFYYVNPGLVMGSAPHNSVLKDVLKLYDSLHFLNEDGTPNLSNTSPVVLTNYLKKHGLILNNESQCIGDNIMIYSSYYFSPINPRYFSDKKYEIQPYTYSIHRGVASWVSPWVKFKTFCSILYHKLFD